MEQSGSLHPATLSIQFTKCTEYACASTHGIMGIVMIKYFTVTIIQCSSCDGKATD